MATLTTTPIKTFVSGETVTPAKLNELSQSTVALTAGTIVDADVSASAAIALSKLATGALPTAITVASATLVDGTIVNADINATAAIAGSKLADAGITAAKLDGAQTGSAPIYGCRAWVNFDGTAGTTVDGEFRCTIRAAGNVSKVVRTAAGTYTMTFATAMPDANYAALTNAEAGGSTGQRSAQTISQLAGSFEFQTRLQGSSSGENMSYNRVAIFR